MRLIQRQWLGKGFFQKLRAATDRLALHQAVYNSILKCDVSFQEELFGNVVLSGGNSKFPGMAERLQKELADLVPSTMHA